MADAPTAGAARYASVAEVRADVERAGGDASGLCGFGRCFCVKAAPGISGRKERGHWPRFQEADRNRRLLATAIAAFDSRQELRGTLQLPRCEPTWNGLAATPPRCAGWGAASASRPPWVSPGRNEGTGHSFRSRSAVIGCCSAPPLLHSTAWSPVQRTRVYARRWSGS